MQCIHGLGIDDLYLDEHEHVEETWTLTDLFIYAWSMYLSYGDDSSDSSLYSGYC